MKVEHNSRNKILSLRYKVMKLHVSIRRIIDKWGFESILKEDVLAYRKYYAGVGPKNVERVHEKSQNIR
jgi:hypothetical protein